MPANVNTTFHTDNAQTKRIAGDLLFAPERSGKFDVGASPWFPEYPGLSPSSITSGDTINQPYITTHLQKSVTIPGQQSGFLSTISVDFGRYSLNNSSDLFRNNHSAKVILTIRKNQQAPSIRGRQFMFNIVINRLDNSNWNVDIESLVNDFTYSSNPLTSFYLTFTHEYDTSTQIYTLNLRRNYSNSSISSMNIYGMAYVNT